MEDGKAKITVTGSGEMTGGEALSTAVSGKFYKKNGSIYLLYELDGEEIQEKPVKHMLKINETALEITKTYEKFKTRLNFKLNEKTEAEYLSPFGLLEFTAHTDFFSLTETKDGILLEASYLLCSEGADPLRNNLKISASAED